MVSEAPPLTLMSHSTIIIREKKLIEYFNEMIKNYQREKKKTSIMKKNLHLHAQNDSRLVQKNESVRKHAKKGTKHIN